MRGAAEVRRASLLAICAGALLAGSCGWTSGRDLVALKAPAYGGAPYEAARLGDYSSGELLGFLTVEARRRQKPGANLEAMRWDVAAELASRKPLALLLTAFEKSADPEQRLGALMAFYIMDDWRIAPALQKHLGKVATEEAYYCAHCVARAGDPQALKILNDNYGRYPVSSAQWACTVELFGRYRYRPAAGNLVGSLDATSLNLAGAAGGSLCQIFPGPHPGKMTRAEAREYFAKLVAETP